ncbi:hypothetical protein ACFQV2_18900 [Actinokineospora soli]|uniref:Uncharacterized protein n=1 Tax=Actinokineospora soli TaxID=1048753 RepID=A0ABW2TNA9_9PSEU
MPQTDRSGDRVVPARPIDPPSPRREDDRVRGREDWQGGHPEPEREGHPAPESTGRPTPENAGRREPEGAGRHEDEGRHVPEGADRSRHAGADASARDGAALEREQVPTRAMAAPRRGGVFSAEEAESLRGRWHRVQGSFVDDPGASVEEADKLVVDALKVLAEHKRALEGWRRGAETEDLRRALQGYRMFLDRLLEV